MTDFRKSIECPEKWNLLREIGKKTGLDTLVETGGYHGATMEYLRNDFKRLVTIELGEGLYKDIYNLGIPNVLCLWGDSGRVLEQFLLFYNEPALFWLDAHPSGGDTVSADDPSMGNELRSVLRRNCRTDIVLVDDVGQPGLEQEYISGIVDGFPEWQVQFNGTIALVTAKRSVNDA